MEGGQMEDDGGQNSGEKEGAGLLGEVHYEDIGNGRVRCVETGHELPLNLVQSYGRSKSCRLALIDRAMAEHKPPLNLFEQSTIDKCKLICKLTGATVNKTEEHIWKHISGRKFQHKLGKKEAEKQGLSKGKDKHEKAVGCKNRRIKVRKHKKVETSKTNSSLGAECDTSRDAEEPDFWTPPEGNRWDSDNGEDRWEGLSSSRTGLKRLKDKMPQKGNNLDEGVHSLGDVDAADVTIRTKRMSIAVGPSSFASRKKKSKVKNKVMENGG